MIGFRPYPAVGTEIGERPVHPLGDFGLELGILQKIGQRDETVQIIRPDFPVFAFTAQPGALRPKIGEHFLQVSGKTVGLNLELVFQPAPWQNRSERKRDKSAFGNINSFRHDLLTSEK